MAIIKIARFWPGQRARAATAAAAAAEPEGLDAFGSEREPSAPAGTGKAVLTLAPPPGTTAPPSRGRGRALMFFKWTLVVLLSAAAAGAGVWAYYQRRAAMPGSSQLVVETTPAGLDVAIAGQFRGRTPLTVDLPAGNYEVRIGSGAQQRVLQATLAAGRTLVERVEVPPAVITGALHIETEPAGLPVMVDGAGRGRSPVTLNELVPGEHQVVVAGASGPVRRIVTVRSSETVSLIVSAAERAVASGGWLVVTSPLPLQLREGGKVIGSTDMERIMLPAGQHVLELANESAGYRDERRVSITAGNTLRLAIAVPEGTLSINAQPWAEVWLDGRQLGETPLGNLSVPIGPHEIVFRHPELGERRTGVVVRLGQPARVGIDMRKQ